MLKVLKKNICEYILRISNFRQKNVNSLIVAKSLEGAQGLWYFLTSILLQNIKKLKGEHLGTIKILEKVSKAEKRKSHNSEKCGKGDP